MSGHSFASTDDDLKALRDRADKVKPHTPLKEVERLFPVYRGPVNSTTLPNGISIAVPAHAIDYPLNTFTSSSLAIDTYYLAPDIKIEIGYNSAISDKPINSIAVEYRPTFTGDEWKKTLQANIGSVTIEVNISANICFDLPESVSQILEKVPPGELFAFFKVLRSESAMPQNPSVTENLVRQNREENLHLWSLIVKQHLHGQQAKLSDGTVLMTYNTQDSK